MKSKRRHGFTLVELLVVICMVTLFAGLITPLLTKAQLRARTLACSNNLRQIGLATSLYAAEHDQVLPLIEPWPDSPIYPTASGAQTIVDALGTYGITKDQTLKCTTDVAGPNYYKKEGSSYCWCPMANSQKVQAVKVAWLGGSSEITSDKLFMAYDYSDVHSGGSNILYADGHVAVANEDVGSLTR